LLISTSIVKNNYLNSDFECGTVATVLHKVLVGPKKYRKTS